MRTDPTIRRRSGDETPSAVRRASHRPRSQVILASVALVAVVSAGVATIAWLREVGDDDRAVARALQARDDAVEQIDVLTDRVARLEDRLGADVSGLETELEASRRALRDARAQLAAIAGPVLPDGRHLVRIVSVGEDQRPPRLVVDLMHWFTDQAAVDAALADGVPPGDAGVDGFYIRNASPRWRIVELDPAAPVALTTYPHGQVDDPGVVDLRRFSTLYSTSDDALRFSPYWVTVRNGTVVRIDEQYTP